MHTANMHTADMHTANMHTANMHTANMPSKDMRAPPQPGPVCALMLTHIVICTTQQTPAVPSWECT